MNLVPTDLAIATSVPYAFSASGGVAPYTYTASVGSIGISSGLYVSPNATGTDIVTATDTLGASASVQVAILSPLELLCDVLSRELELDSGRVFLWDQKVFKPVDDGLYIPVGIINLKPFSSINRFVDGESIQAANFSAQVSIDVISRGMAAVTRKEEVMMALKSNYSEAQQNLNGFRIFPLTTGFTNLSHLDGSAIPYRFNLTVNIQYQVTKVKAVPYFENFEDPSLDIEP